MLSDVGAEFAEPVHNHGIWNMLLICTGQMHFCGYRRLDDQTKEFYAELELVEDSLVGPAGLGIVGPPPHDIHALDGFTDGTWMVTIVPGPASSTRHIFDLETNSYREQSLAGAVKEFNRSS
jgi:hypothetical protein